MCDFTFIFKYIDGLENVKKTCFFFPGKNLPCVQEWAELYFQNTRQSSQLV